MGRYVDLHCHYDFCNWIEGFAGLSHACYSFDYYRSFVEDGPFSAERRILGLVQEHSVDLVIVPNMYFEISGSFLHTLRTAGAKSLVVFFDDSGRFENTNRYYLGLCEYIVTHETKAALELYQPYGVIVDFFPCFPSVSFYSRLLAERGAAIPDHGDVSFVGAKSVDRSAFLDALTAAGLAVSVYGSGWPNGRVSQLSMLQIFRDSKVSLNFTKSLVLDGGKQLKARAFEIVLAGGFLLTEYDAELVAYFEAGSEIDTFSSPDECVQKTRYYLENPLIRETIRQRGWEKCRGQLSFESAWTRYLGCLELRSGPGGIGTTIGSCPIKAVRAFVRWNISYLVGRLKTRHPRLAVDQLVWAARDVRFLSGIYSGVVWLVFISETALYFLRSVRDRLVEPRLRQRIGRLLFHGKGLGGRVQ